MGEAAVAAAKAIGYVGAGTVEFIVYPGAYHASEVFAPAAALSAKISGRRIEALKGDIRDPAAVAKAMAGVQWVVHTAAALPLYPRDVIFSTDVGGTRLVLTHQGFGAGPGFDQLHVFFADGDRQTLEALQKLLVE